MAADQNDKAPAGRPPCDRPCPICGKPSSPETKPFCSKRCADIDLHRWLGGIYVVPEAEAPSKPVGDRDDDDA